MLLSFIKLWTQLSSERGPFDHKQLYFFIGIQYKKVLFSPIKAVWPQHSEAAALQTGIDYYAPVQAKDI